MNKNKYHRTIQDIEGNEMDGLIDVYSVIKAFNITNPAQQHMVKKALCAGLRGKNDYKNDMLECHQAIDRAIAIEKSIDDIVDEVKQEIEDEGLLLSISDLQIVLKDKNENRYGFVSGINSESPILCSSCCFEDNEALCDLAPCRSTERNDGIDGYFIKV